MDELKGILQKEDPDIATIVECLPKYTKSPIQKSELEIKGYELHWNVDHSNCHRGICIYTKCGLTSSEEEGLTLFHFKESLWVTIRLNSREEQLLLGVIYRSPASSVDDSLKVIDLINAASDKKATNLCICGDFNLPKVRWKDGQGTTQIDQDSDDRTSDSFEGNFF